MTEEFDQDLASVPESGAEQALAAAANVIPAVGSPIVVDPYSVLADTAPNFAEPEPVVSAAPETTTYYGAVQGTAAVPSSAPHVVTTPLPSPSAPYGYHGQTAMINGQPHVIYPLPTGYHPPYPVPAGYAGPYFNQPKLRTDGLAIAALVCGIAGFFIPLGIPSILGLVFGIVGLHRIREQHLGGRPLAIAGIVTGAVSLFTSLLLLIPLLIGIANDWYW